MSDLISRQAVLDYPIRLNHYDEEHGNRHFVLGIESVMEYVEYLPSADRPTGEWVEKDGECVCSECGNSVSFSRTKYGWVLGKCCQTCGARMYKGNVQRR